MTQPSQQVAVRGMPFSSSRALSRVPAGRQDTHHIFTSERSLRGVRVLCRRTRRSPEGLVELPPPTSNSLRLHTICPYYTMFPLKFPFEALTDAGDGGWVLDPFCGRGTTIFAARLLGLPSVGVDSNPVAAAVAAAKLAAPRLRDVISIAENALASDECDDVPTGRFWDLCYHPETLIGICKLRRRLLSHCKSDAEIALRALVLGILHGPRQKGPPTYLSSQMPRTYASKPASAIRYWENHEILHPPRVDVLDAVTRRARFTLAEVPPAAPGIVSFGDSRRVNLSPPGDARCAWIVTSPPYFGMRTYRPDQWLRNWFLGGPPYVDYSQEGQLAHHADGFAEQLGRVWSNVASACVANARLVLRFGCIPSSPVTPQELIVRSLESSGRRWRLVSARDGGSAGNGKRQSDQFGRTTEAAKQEVDIMVVLED